MTDFATLVLTVDASSVDRGAESLDRFTAAGGRAAGVGAATANATRATGAAAARMAADAQAATQAVVGAATGFTRMGSAGGLAAHHMTNLSFQINDVVSGLAMGQRPMQVFLQQSGQMYQIMQQAGLGFRGFAVEALKMVGILQVVQDAELAQEAAASAMAANALKAASQRAQANIAAADTELALAEANVASATTSEALIEAQARLAGAHAAVAAAARGAEVAEIALAQAQARAAAAGEASASASYTSLTKLGGALTALTVAAGLAFAGFKAFQMVVADSGELNRFAEGLKLTDEQIRKAGGSVKYLADGTRQITGLTVTMGDAVRGVWKTIADHAGLDSSLEGLKKFFIDQFMQMLNAAIDVYAELYGDIVGTYRAIIIIWQNFPKAIGDIFVQGVNAAINAINKLLEASVSGVNGFLDRVNSVLPQKLQLDHLAGAHIDNIENAYAGAAAKVGGALSAEVARATAEAKAQGKAITEEVQRNILDAAKKRLQETSDANKPKAGPKANDHGLTDALAQLDAQIKGQWALAKAYQESDAAAMRAEARLKAEEQAIRHKGDVELFYTKELALAVAQRAADGAKQIADLNAEAGARKRVNDMVEDGLIPASQAGQALELETKLRPLQAAMQNADAEGKRKLLGIIQGVVTGQAALNEQIAREAALRTLAGKDDELAKLKLETDLIGSSNLERARRLALLEAENYIRDNNITRPEDIENLKKKYLDAAEGQVTLTEGQEAYNVSLGHTLEMLNLMVEQTQTVGQLLSDAFGQAGSAVGDALNNLASYQAKEQEIVDWKTEALKKVAAGSEAASQIEQEAAAKSRNAQLSAVSSVLSTFKNLFKEHSAGYRIMATAEKALAVIQAVNAAKSLANAAKSVVAGAAKMFEILGPFAFPAVAAMMAVMAAVGFSGGGSSVQAAPTSPEDLQKAAGTGTVLGSPDARSESIANSLALMAKNSTKGLDQTADMVRSLRNIRDGIGALTAAIARSLNLSGGFFDTTGKLGTNSSGGLFGIGGLFSSTSTKSLYDQGININGGSLEQIIANGFSGATYQIIETITKNSGFLGIGGSTKTTYDKTYGSLPPEVAAQFQLITENLFNSVVEAAKMLGYDVEEALKQFQVQIGQISFKGLTGDQIQAELEAVFSKLGDQMAGFAVAGLEQYQKAGEGLYETLMRIAKDFVTVGSALDSIGLIAPASIEAREALINLAGGLDEFVSQVNYYFDNFLTTAEQMSFLQEQVDAAFANMGIAVPESIEAFKALVSAQDLTTEAGQALYAQLMAIAPAFYNLETAAEQAAAAAAAAAAQIAKQKTQLQIQLLEAQGKASEALALKRQMELEAMDESLRGLQQQVWAAQDVAQAKDNLLAAYKRESSELQQTIDKFHGFSATLREFRASIFAANGGAMDYKSSLIALMKQSGLANAGDEGALGGGLQSAAQSFLDVATANASSLQDVQRARALVARYVDQAIGASDGLGSVAERQLSQLKTQVSKLIDINESVQTVAQAIQALKKLMFPTGGTSGTGVGTGGTGVGIGTGNGTTVFPPRVVDILDRVNSRLNEISENTQQGAVAGNRTARTLERATRGGDSLVVSTDEDTPVAVVSDGVSLS